MGANWPMPNPVASGAPNPHSYDLATAGVVRDNVTALDWEQGHSEALSWRAATTYCADLDLGGHSDWRVPTRIELVSLLDFSRTNPPLDATAFPSTVGPTFWTSSVLAELPNSTNPMSVWVMDIVAAGTTGTRMSAPYPSGTSLTARVRCVRGEPPAPAVRFKVETDTVYDNGTRLTWHRGISSTGVTWEAAKQACVDLTTAGGGWRLPTVKELLTIVDERTLIPAIDATAFPGTPGVATSARAWTSSALAGNQYSAWIVTFERGHAETNSRELSGFVRCVR
jgi:hypothetical protein